MASTSVEELARQLNVDPERVNRLIDRTVLDLPQKTYYVFRTSSERGRGGPEMQRPRTIAAFPSPDDALSFAQRNGYAVSAQTRTLSARELLKLMLRDPKVSSILFLQPMSGDNNVRGFPPGVTVTRQSLLDQLQNSHAAPAELTAKAYDALQFGVDFGRRGAFRAALTEAVENVVAEYVPPEGSLDRGPRSVFATGAVEQWLREHGFPHARQRRWANVADEYGWNGADELYEIDCGTEQRLLVQLLIHNQDDRQYIGRVIVTS